MVIFFHEIFLQLPVLLQMQQIYFKPKIDTITCLLCGVHCSSCIDVAYHLTSKSHEKNLKKRIEIDQKRTKVLKENVIDTRTREFYGKESSNKIYDQTVMDTIYLNLTQYTIMQDDESLLYLQNRNGAIYCLICRKTVTDIAEHVQYNHLDKYKISIMLGMIKRFHKGFRKLSPVLQMEQIYFRPKRKKLSCLKCSSCCGYESESIEKHLASDHHRRLSERYAANLAKDATKSVDDNYFTDQAIKISEGNIGKQSVLAINYQLSQESNYVKYYISSSIPSNECASGPTKKTNATKEAAQKPRIQETNPTLANELEGFDNSYCFTQEPNCVKYYVYSTILSEISNNLTTAISSSVPKLESNTKGEQKSKNSSNKTLNDGSINKPHVVQNANNFICASITSENLEGNTMYDLSILDTVYSNLTQYVVQYIGKEYMCLQNRNGKLFCLLCRLPVDNVDHVYCTEHINNGYHPEKLSLLYFYHNIFASLALHYQAQQVHFFNGVHNMLCCVCNDAVPYVLGDVIAHMDSKSHIEQMIKKNKENESAVDSSDEDEDSMDEGEDCDPYENIVQQPKTMVLIGDNVYYCLYCYMKCKSNEIEKHVKTSAHFRKLKIKNKAVDEYLVQLRKLVLPLHNEIPIAFIPSTSHLTFCLKCGVYMEYHKLKNHVDQFHQDTEYSLKDKLTENFPNLPEPYSKEVLQTFFKDSPPQCNIIIKEKSYPVLQNCYQGLYCLLCKKFLEESALDHLASETHIDLRCNFQYCKRAIMRYHTNWTKLDSLYWNHIPFVNNQNGLFYCLICDVRIGKRKLKHHLECQEHRDSLIKLQHNELGSRNDLTNTEQESQLPEKMSDAEILANMYPQKINEEVRKMNGLNVDIIQTSPNNKFTCLICLVEIIDVIKHILDVHHHPRLVDFTANIEPIRSYHQVWNYMDVELKVLQNLFYPIAPTVTFCTTCGFNLNYSYLLIHLKQCHGGAEIEFQDKLNPVFIFASKKEYYPKVRNILYKDNVPQCDMILESISYPVIQTYSTMRCLLCYKEISENKYTHLSSKEHIANMLRVAMRKKLKRYHDVWLDGDEDFQMQQIYFERDGPSLYCKICLEDLSASDLREHIRSDLHGISLKKFLINERISGKAVVCQDIEIMPQLYYDKGKMESTHSDDNDVLYSESEDSEAGATCYSKAALEEFYPNFNSHNVIVHNIRYPIFRKTVVGLKCMICKRHPEVTSIDQHIALNSHKIKLVDPKAHNKFRKFHDVWMKQEPSVQIHQKYFHRIKCIPCDVQVEYEGIADHVLKQGHKINISLPFLKNENEDCSDTSFKSVAVSPPVNYNSNALVQMKNQDSNREGSPLKEVANNNKKSVSAPKPESSKKSGHNIRKSVQNPKDPIIINKIPLRYATHRKFLIIDKNGNVFCECCSKKLKADVPSIKEHLDSAQHCIVAQTNKTKFKYYCDICMKHYSSDSSWDNHLVDLTHLARYNNLGKDRREQMTEHECLTCKLVIFGDKISLKRHNSGLSKRKVKEITLPKPVMYLLSTRNCIIQNAEKLLLEANAASQSQDKERQVCIALVKVIKEIYPMCKAYPFGSRVTGLGYCDSDLDVFLDIGDMYHGSQNQDPIDQAHIVNKIAKLLQKHKNSFTDINKVAAARTPIVQVFHKDSNVDCDISFRHGLSVENTAFISLCLDIQPIIRPTILYLKEWYAATNLSGLSSYALTILMVFYLQTKGYLLSIRELRHINPERSNIIDGWETIKYSISLVKMKEYVNKCEYTVIQLMENFFEYYAKFDFEKWVICPLMGYLIEKSNFNGYGTTLPSEMGRYVAKLYCANPEYFRNLTPMCVQDPFDLSHNLTKACCKDTVRKFQAYCDLSKKHISALT